MITCTTFMARTTLLGLALTASLLTGCASGPQYELFSEEQAQQFIDERTRTMKGPSNFRLHSHYRQYTRMSANYYKFGNFRCNGSTYLKSLIVHRITEDDRRNVRVEAMSRSECDSQATPFSMTGRHDGERLFLRDTNKPSAIFVYRMWPLPAPNFLSEGDDDIPQRLVTEFLTKPPYSGQEFFHFYAKEGSWEMANGQPEFIAIPAGTKEEGRTTTLSPWFGGDGNHRFTFVHWRNVNDSGTVSAKDSGYYAMPDDLTGMRVLTSDPTPERPKISSGSYMANQLNSTLGTMQRLNEQTQKGLESLRANAASTARTSAPSATSQAPTPVTNAQQKNAASGSVAPTAKPTTLGSRELPSVTTPAGATAKSRATDTVTASASGLTSASKSASTSAQTTSSDDGCQTNVGWCASSGEKRETSDFSIGVTNTCPFRLLTKICVELKDGKWSCGQDGHHAGKRTGFWVSRDQATGRYTVRSVGSTKPSMDWVCSAKVPGWNTP